MLTVVTKIHTRTTNVSKVVKYLVVKYDDHFKG